MEEKSHYFSEVRRQIIKFGPLALLRAVAFEWLNQEASKPRISEMESLAAKQLQESMQAIEQGAKLEVWHFSSEIINAAANLIDYNKTANMVGRTSGWFLVDALLGMLLEKHSELVNRGAGAGAMFVGKSIDLMSTIAVGFAFQDSRMDEYKLNTFFGESNESLSRTFTVNEVTTKSPRILILSTTLAAIFPSIGRGYLGSSPAVAINNYAAARAANIAMDIGDEVRLLISAGRNEDFIRQFIEFYGNEVEETPH